MTEWSQKGGRNVPHETFFNLPHEKRKRILDVLLDEFSLSDYQGVSVARIAERAGIAKGSFYQYFEDKRDCYMYLVDMALEEKTAFLRQPAPAEAGDVFQTLRWMMDQGLQFEFSNPRLAHILYRAVFEQPALQGQIAEAIRQRAMDGFRDFVRRGVEAGDIHPRIDPDLAAFFFNTIFSHLGVYLMKRYDISPDQLLQRGSGAFDEEAVRSAVKQAIAILERGLRGDPSRTE